MYYESTNVNIYKTAVCPFIDGILAAHPQL